MRTSSVTAVLRRLVGPLADRWWWRNAEPGEECVDASGHLPNYNKAMRRARWHRDGVVLSDEPSLVPHLHRPPGEVDEQPLPGRVHLPHGRRQPALPGPVELAPAAVLVAARIGSPVLLPEQHQRHAGPSQLPVHLDPVGLGLAPLPRHRPGAGEQQRLQRPVREPLRQGPSQPSRHHPVQAEPRRAARHPHRARNRPVGGARLLLQPQDLSYASHRHSLGWHRPPLASCAKGTRLPPSGRATTHPRKGVADFRSEWPTSSRNYRPTSFWNGWPTCPGIRKLITRKRYNARPVSALDWQIGVVEPEAQRAA